MGDEALAIGGAMAVLGVPAGGAHVHAFEAGAGLVQDGVVGLAVAERLAASLTGAGAGLDMPFVHELPEPKMGLT
jgi:hypothetical protein